MLISKDFGGGNIRILKVEENTVYLDNELKDSKEDWFYWCFSVTGNENETVNFVFPENRIGYYGPAVSNDLENWKWYGKGKDENSFSYTFGKNGEMVYFAHSMLYRPERFFEFAKKNKLSVKELTKTKKGRSVPFFTLGEGKRMVLLTARHHACESTGNYILEGVFSYFENKPLNDAKIVCIPFVDYDGVLDGDQGKGRTPYDHNRDYMADKSAIYPETKAIRELAKEGIFYAFDFHSPWHKGGENDNIFIVQKRHEKIEEYKKFGELLEKHCNENSLVYKRKNDLPPDYMWNSSKTECFSTYMNDFAKAKLSFSLECAYFGKEDNIFEIEKALEFGKCFAESLEEYDRKMLKLPEDYR